MYLKFKRKWCWYKLRRGLSGLVSRNSRALFKSQNDKRATCSPPPYNLFSPNASDGNFDIAICSKIVQMSRSMAFEIDTTPQSLNARVISYTPGAYNLFMEGVVVLTLEEAHLIGNI